MKWCGKNKLVSLALVVEVFVDFAQVFVGEVSIDLRGADIGVAQEHLHRAEVSAVLQEVGSKRVTHDVRGYLFRNASFNSIPFDNAFN